MDEMDDFRVLQATSTEVKNRYLTPGEILYAIDTGTYYVGGKDGKPQALISSSTSSDGGLGSKPWQDGVVVKAGDQRVTAIAPRTTPVRVALIGESHATPGVIQSPASYDTTVVNVPFPASGQTAVKLDATRWALPMLYPQAYLVAAAGISGQTTQQILDRDAAAFSATRYAITDALAAAPDACIIRDCTNDVTALTAAASTQADIDAIKSRHLLIVQRGLAGCPVIIDESVRGYSPPTGVSAADIAFRQAAIVQLNAYKKSLESLYPGRVYYCDLVGYTQNADGSRISNTSTDGIHDLQYGAYRAAIPEAILMSRIFGPSSGPRYKGTNLFSNALFASTSSTGQGTVAAGVAITGASATVSDAKIEIIDGKPWQTAIFTPTVTDGNARGYFRMSFDPSAWGWLANDLIGCEFDYLIGLTDSTMPETVVNGMSAYLDLFKTGAGDIQVQGIVGNTIPGIADVLTGRIVVPPIKLPEASSVMTAACNLTLQSYYKGSTPLKLGISMPRLIRNPL
ncbi:MAG: SGNH/GDSL hydrolase family protein [Afipia sp.]